MKRKPFMIIIKGAGYVLLSACIGLLLLCAVYALPVDKINHNIKQSLSVFEEEGEYPTLMDNCTSTLDNFTDALMLLKVRYDGDESVLNKALMVYHNGIASGENEPVERLLSNDGENKEKSSYARYWHGYLVVLKPLFSIFNYKTIRGINTIVQILVALLLVIVMFRKNLKLYIVPYIVSVFMIAPWVNIKSLQFSTIYYIFTIGSIILILKNNHWKKKEGYLFGFLFIGICTSYFDFLTYPLATFGIPMIFCFCMNHGTGIKGRVVEFTKSLFFWGFGYVGMWSCKWILASLLTEHNILAETLHFITLRSSNTDFEGNTVSISETVSRNISAFLNNPAKLLVGVYIVCIVVIMLVTILIKKQNIFHGIIENIFSFGFIAILPMVWYIGAQNHSHLHYWFTYKLLIVTVFSLLCMLTAAIEKQQIFSRRKKRTWLLSFTAVLLLVFCYEVYSYLNRNKASTEIIQEVRAEGTLVFEGRDNELYYYNENLYYLVDKEYTNKKVFLHIYPQDKNLMAKEEEFINKDFGFGEYELRSYWWQPIKIACVSLEDMGFDITSLETGQYDESGQIWTAKVKMKDFIEPLD